MTAMPPISPSSALPVVATFTIPENNQELGEALTRLAGHINAAQYRFLLPSCNQRKTIRSCCRRSRCR
jgi:hypothetical protein